MTSRVALGIDIGGSGIKGAPVDLDRGVLLADRVKIETPAESTPQAVAEIVRQIATHFIDTLPADAPIGVTIPGVVQHGVVRTAANIDKAWLDCPGEALFSATLGRRCLLVNDADAAGVAELRHGAAKDVEGLVIVTTLGTGIGIALLHNGVLIPNAELGHLELDGHDAETRAAASAREREGLSWNKWAGRLQRYYTHLENLLWPDLFVVGGGVSRKSEKFLPLLSLRTPIVPAELQNAAGIIGAAALAAD
ncbi:MAG: ROK family protein [Actinomycetales bacterium]|jgi:polyphosphate glucokinase|uniref:ROK family protein n=1 Tax=Candidatus Phosphoribacter hodrii TaxID=2953743 RepID=A0A935IIQ3_9MICO|nr:ROK family protein [Candidatus Phosphoribacter hodrii]HOA01132.1 ROK family protein [Dermatophilaceae bacterium]MBK7272819.1 ROK family protein [Candidatus Phosphoribacter hodrii]MBL0004815.1 ROK family protein [Candidatus Phosphoribacter hodrii]HOA56789.1 ROK family protein [Dermatophilaceae bacterium]